MTSQNTVGLAIPTAAHEEWFRCGCGDPTCGREGFRKEALPIVVAAELRRLAAVISADITDDPTDEVDDAYGTGLDDAQRALHARADELDPPAVRQED